MKAKIVSIFLSLVMVSSIFAALTQNLGPLSMNASGAGGLANSPWPKFRGNLRNTGLSPYDTSGNNGKEKWNFTTGNIIWQSSPAIGFDGTIYVGSQDDNLYAINPDGTEKWSFTTNDGVTSSPAIGADGTIYVGSNDHKLYAINSDGTQKWSFMTNNRIWSPPAIGSDGTIYVGSWDIKLYAINPDGSEKWNFTTGFHVDSSPAIDFNGTIYFGSRDNFLYAINPDGTEKWSFLTFGRITSSPAIGPDGTIFVQSEVGAPDSKLFAINPDGTEKWNFTTGWSQASSPAIGFDGTIYIGTRDGLFAVNPDGSEKWNFTTGDSIYYSSPAISSDGTIYIGSQDYKLYAINPDGTEKWNFTTGFHVDSSPAIGSDGTIYIGSEDNKLYAIGTPIIPPITDAGPDQTVNEGDIVQFNGTGSFVPNGTIETYEWDFESDGIYDYVETATGSPDGAFDGKTTHIYGDNGVYTATLKVISTDGANDTDTCNVTVNNLPPTIYPFGPFIVGLGFPLTINANASDPGSDDLTFTLSWGDGTSDTITVFYNNGMAPDPYPSPWGTFPFSVNDIVQHTYGNASNYWINLTVEDDDGGVTQYTINVTVIDVASPGLYIDVSLDGEDVILYWDTPSILGIDHYLIYRSTSQTGFDFNTVWVNTSKDNESGEPDPMPLRTIWNDTKAALPGDSNYKKEYYYIIRAVDVLSRVSYTSRTVGKWTRTFQQGVSTFSLPLEPQETMNTTIDHYLNDMNARYIRWMNPVNHIWMKHGEGEVNDTQIEVGKGYKVAFDSLTNYTFIGLPGAVIRYDDDTGFSGFDPTSEAKNLTVIVDPVTGNVTLNWTKPSSIGINDRYHILRSTIRDGFWNGNYLKIATLNFDILSYIDIGNATAGTQYYYMIVPVNETGFIGSSTYSIGVWTEEYLSQYDTFGIPLKLESYQTADWYCDNIPSTVGINYFNNSQERWRWHSTRMPEGAFDPLLEMTEGYQISTSSTTKFTFIGV